MSFDANIQHILIFGSISKEITERYLDLYKAILGADYLFHEPSWVEYDLKLKTGVRTAYGLYLSETCYTEYISDLVDYIKELVKAVRNDSYSAYYHDLQIPNTN